MYFLKYRPQTIEDLDLKNVRRELKKILTKKSIPHAFLFAGPKGTGKTSAARIVAKVVNCSDKKGIEPCNRCEVCQEITRGTSLDVIEIDAASNRGIDDIRQLKEKIGLAPIKAKYKVYIIDEVHMLTNQAFNALLKTLEEPPAHVIFILCTTDPDKIIPTVMSRLLRIDFRRGTPDEVKRSLKKVIQGENLNIDDKVVEKIIKLSEGGFRDAQKMVESLVLNLGDKIKRKEAKEMLGHWEKRKPETVLELIAESRLDQLMTIGEELSAEGAGFSDYLKELLNLIRDLILAKTGAKKSSNFDALTGKFTLSQLVKLSDLFSEAAYRQKNSLIPQLPFQLAVIKFLENKTDSEQQTASSESNDNKKKSKQGKKRKLKDTRNKLGSVNLEMNEIKEKWEELLEAVKPMNHSVAAFLKAAQPSKIEGDALILQVFYQFHKDKLEEHRNRRIVEKGIEEVFDSCVKIKCKLGKKKNNLYNTAKDIFEGR